MRHLILGLSFCLTLPAFAATIGDGVADTPPAMPAETKSNKPQPQPDIRIVEKGDATLTEYRINGRLYQIKVVPKVGKPYFLIDPNGQGNFVTQGNMIDNIAVPSWVILEF
ncbi:DUF2782 domain-containing protein [uncultured Deefgea sp.]|uniref:DUF2782 domain-containing protein n=1 Tax=uncultured Deefgea sp. TaxID=1304914 RepID=UPI00262C9A3D|nr:DUF2782 domain-containing protein [uncultured Deefgea sp.]